MTPMLCDGCNREGGAIRPVDETDHVTFCDPCWEALRAMGTDPKDSCDA